MKAISRRTALVLAAGAVVAVTIGLLVFARDEEPCLGTFMGAKVMYSMLDIDQTTASLTLLNGSEDPKLKRILEWRLASAIHAAREAIDHDPMMEPVSLPTMVPNWKSSIKGARAYVVEHHLDDSQSLKEIDRNLRPTEDLVAIESWLETQPDGSKSNG